MFGQTPKALVWMDKQIHLLTGLFAVIGGIAVLALVGITAVAVGWRYGLNNPIFGIEDLSIVTLTVVAAASVAYGGRHQAHVSVNIINRFARRSFTRWTDALMRLLTFSISAMASYALFTKACGIEKACITANFSIEHWAFYLILGAAMAIYCAQILIHFLVSLFHWNGVDPNTMRD